MPAPIFSLATSGTDPKATTSQILEDEVNRVVGIVYDQANPEDRDSAADSAAAAADAAAQTELDRVQTGLDVQAAQAAAEASGDVVFYDTKADATAALGGLAEDQVVRIFADESKGGRSEFYRVESAALVHKPVLFAKRTFYLDPANGSDGASGARADAPMLTLAATVAKMAIGDDLAVARGARLHGALSGLPDYCKVRSYGSGPKAIFDGSRKITSAFTGDGSDTYYVEQVHEVATAPTASVGALSPWFQLWLEKNGQTAVTLSPYFEGGTQAANIAYVKANPGTFTCYQVGSSAADPRTDTSGAKTTYRYYVHLPDGGDPDASGTEVYYGESGRVLTLSKGMNVDGIVFQRTITKDLTGDNQNEGGHVTNCEFYEAAVHSFVGLATGANNRIVTNRASAYEYGGGWHSFRSTSTLGTSPGPVLDDSYIEGHAYPIYSHGSAQEDVEHEQAVYRNLTIRRCKTAGSIGNAKNGYLFDGIDAVDTEEFISGGVSAQTAGGKTIVKNSRWLSVSDDRDCMALGLMTDMEVENTKLIFRNTGDQIFCRNLYANLQGDAGDFKTLTLDKVTKVGGGWSNSNRWQQVNLVANDSILGELYPINGIEAVSRTMTLDNCSLTYNGQNLEDIQAVYPDVADDCIVPHVLQTAKQTIAAGDITWISTGRTGSATSGDATLAVNANINGNVAGGGLRILDYDNAGGVWSTTIASVTSETSYELADAPDATFSGKTIELAFAAGPFWPASSSVTGSFSEDGATFTASDADWIDAGTYLYLGGIGRRADFGVVKISEKSGSDLALGEAIEWKTNGGIDFNTTYVSPPAVSVQYQFPLTVETLLLNVDRADGVNDVVNLAEEVFGEPRGRFDNAEYRMNANGSWAAGGGQIHHELGEVDIALPVSEGDVVKLTATAYIQEFEPQWAADPETSGTAMLAAGSYLASRGIGAT